MASAGVIAPPPGFLATVAAAARRAGALLVLDEVVTLRLAPGGAQAAAGVRPDLTMMGKLIGGGFPIGAVGGSAELMGLLDPRRRDALQHSGTFNGNPISCAAGASAVRALTAEAIDRMASQGDRLATSLVASAARYGVPFSVTRAGSLLNLYLCETPQPLRHARPDEERMAAFHLAALEAGLYLAPRGMVALCTAIDAPLLDEVCERFDDAFALVARRG
jgi:glutamate-1-semialdehyde 2,1-aminomutase